MHAHVQQKHSMSTGCLHGIPYLSVMNQIRWEDVQQKNKWSIPSLKRKKKKKSFIDNLDGVSQDSISLFSIFYFLFV